MILIHELQYLHGQDNIEQKFLDQKYEEHDIHLLVGHEQQQSLQKILD